MKRPGPDLDPDPRAALMAYWRANGRPAHLLLAVSGGGDSIALLIASDVLREAGVTLSVATVDHGLRPAGRVEAQMVARQCSARGIDHTILRWTDEKPTSGLQAKARAARYRLLARHGAGLGVSGVVTGHTLDDQAETVMMRLARGAGARGLKGMCDGGAPPGGDASYPQNRRCLSESGKRAIADGPGPPIMLHRPFLGLSRAALRNFLTDMGASFVDDPSNDDDTFERVRWRARLAALVVDGGLTARNLARTAEALAASDLITRAREDAVFSGLGLFYRWGAALLDDRAVTDPAAPGLALRLAHAVSGAAGVPDAALAEPQFERLITTGTVTYGGALLRRIGNNIWFCREPGAVLGRSGCAPTPSQTIAPGAALLWDRRFVIRNPFGSPVTVEPFGRKRALPVLFNGPPETGQCMPFMTCHGNEARALSPLNAGSTIMNPLIKERFDGDVNRF